MDKPQYESGRSSSATHRLTQASTTLNRRYVQRPVNLAIEEAASMAEKAEEQNTPTTPSRLVNLGVHRADVEAARAAEEAKQKAAAEKVVIQKPQIEESSQESDTISVDVVPVFPRVIEMGQTESASDDKNHSQAAAESEPSPDSLPETPAAITDSTSYSPEIPSADSTVDTNYQQPIAHYDDASYYNTEANVQPTVAALPSSTQDNNSMQLAAPNDNNIIMSNNDYAANNMVAPMTPMTTMTAPNDYSDTSSSAQGSVMTAPADFDPASLAIDIAADYAAASLGASVAEFGNNYENYAINTPETLNNSPESTAKMPELKSKYSSIEEIAQTAANAITAIHAATDPDQIAEEITKLKEFAESIRVDSAIPEIKDLSNTIDKFVSVAMKSTGVKEAMERKKLAAAQSITIKAPAKASKVALSSKANRAAAKVTKSSARAMAANRNNLNRRSAAARTSRQISAKSPSARKADNMPTLRHNQIARANSAQTARNRQTATAREQALRQAMHSVATMDDQPNQRATRKKPAFQPIKKTSAKRFAVAFACATACVGVFFYIVSSNIPDISMRVAAMQTGIETSYPSYVPRGYSLGDIASEENKISMIFKNSDGNSFTLSEEKSSWDSAALERNYVKTAWSDNYTTTHEQGITIYISGSDAAWVNGGILFKINASNNNLTKKQLRNIVVSL